MNKVVRKLIASILIISILSVMMVAVTYAWVTLSTSPTVNGLQISIGGKDTIKVAPNKSITVNGTTYNYPGAFNDSLNFGSYEEYRYLNQLAGLSPVSTADGLHWAIPTYYGPNDKEVISGDAEAGSIKPIDKFLLDTELEYANLQNAAKSKYGSYVYLDFWVVAPYDYDLRIASGDRSNGSYLVELMNVTSNEGGFTLASGDGYVAASARVGFLVDHNNITDDTMVYYQRSQYYSNQYTKLRGSYQEPNEGIRYSSGYTFTIYEPNGDMHVYESELGYSPTYPIGWDGEFGLVDIRDRLAVQLKSEWIKLREERTYLEETFIAATIGKRYSSAADAQAEFYGEYLQGQILPYLEQGSFVKSTSELYNGIDSPNGSISREDLDRIELSGATEDVCIAQLEKNVPQRVRMFIWIEGQDSDCLGAVESPVLALNIELAGSHNTKNERKEENK